MSPRSWRERADDFEPLKARALEDPETLAHYLRAKHEAAVARSVREVRKHLGLTQQQLADRIGTTASAISRIESEEYEGHSMQTLYKIAAVLDCELEFRLRPRRSS